MKISFVTLSLLLIAGFVHAQFSSSPQQTISVTGYGDVRVPADIIHLKVTLSDAYLSGNENIVSITNQYNHFIRRIGIDPQKNVLKSTEKYQPAAGDDFSTPSETYIYALEFNNTEMYKKFSAGITDIPGADYTVAEYTYSKMQELKDQAYQLAWADVRLRSDKLFAMSGTHPAGIYSIEDLSYNYVPATGGYDYYYGGDYYPPKGDELLVNYNTQIKVVYSFSK